MRRSCPSPSSPDRGGLAGKTLGVVGLGAIGSAITRRALAFDMSVVGLRRTTAAPPDGVSLAPSLEALVAQADHVVLAAPATAATATAATAHLIDATVLRACKPGIH